MERSITCFWLKHIFDKKYKIFSSILFMALKIITELQTKSFSAIGVAY